MDARSNVGNLQLFLAGHFDLDGLGDEEKKEFEESIVALNRGVNGAVGRDNKDLNAPVELGNLFIPSMYDEGWGWREMFGADKIASKEQNKLQIQGGSLCNNQLGMNIFGFDVQYITDSHVRNQYFSEKSTQGTWHRERNSSMIGTSVVAVFAAIAEYMQREEKFRSMSTFLKPPTKRVACYITGMNIHSVFKNKGDINEKSEYVHKDWQAQVGPPKMENMLKFDIIRKRVVCMMDNYLAMKDKRKNNKGVITGKLHNDDAMKWAFTNDPNLTELASGDEHGNEEGKEEEDEEEGVDKEDILEQKTRSYIGRKVDNTPEAANEVKEAEAATKNFQVVPMDVNKFDFTSTGTDDGAAKLLEKYLQDKYLCGNKFEQDLDDALKPKVKRHQLRHKEKVLHVEGKSAEVIVIKNALHPDTVKGILAVYYNPTEGEEGAAFCRDEFKYFRACVTDDDEIPTATATVADEAASGSAEDTPDGAATNEGTAGDATKKQKYTPSLSSLVLDLFTSW